MKLLRKIILFIICSLFFFPAKGQLNIKDSTIQFMLISPSYGGFFPGGDMKDRFGYTSTLGAEFGIKLKNNFYGMTGAHFLFGGAPKSDPLLSLESHSDNAVIGPDGRRVTIRYFERGLLVPFRVGKILSVIKLGNPNSGLYVETGAQFLQHKIQIEVLDTGVPQLTDEYRKGYDHLTNGMGVIQGIGIRYFSSSRLINFFAGFELSENFTQSRRDVDFATGKKDDKPRVDILAGFRAGWSFLIYKRAPAEYYYR